MKEASSADPAPVPRGPAGYPSGPLWLWVAAGFLLLLTAWTALFLAARAARVESVPVAAQPGKP